MFTNGPSEVGSGVRRVSQAVSGALTTTTELSETGVSPVAMADLEEHQRDEAIIESGWQTFVEVGLALKRIRDRKSYLHGFPTFEKYISERWNYGKTYAYRLINGAEVFSELSKVSKVLPQNEAQVRPLIGIPSESLAKVWEKVEREVGTGRLTAEAIQNAARPFQPRRARKARHPSQSKPAIRSDLTSLFDDLRYFITDAEPKKALATVERIQEVMLGNFHTLRQ
mgnify:CR=1 FL=1